MIVCKPIESKAFAIVTFSLGVVQILLIPASWFITATMPISPVRSLLSSEGIRWFFSQFTYNLASPLLVWLILAGMALGALKQSGLSKTFTLSDRKEYRQRFVLKLVLLESIIFAGIIGLLTLMSQAILLSATGHLLSSSFSQSVFPIICFMGCVTSVTFGLLSNNFRSSTDIFNASSVGIGWLFPRLVVHVMAAQLYHSFLFVF